MDVNMPPRGEGLPKLPDVRGWLLPVVLLVLLFSALGSLFYTVNADEVGVVQRLGKYVRTTQPGLHMRWPFGLETVRRVRVTHIFKEEFGFRTIKAGVRTVYSRDTNLPFVGRDARRDSAFGADGFSAESLMLTGDLNIALVEWIVQYRVRDPVKYSFKVRNMQETIRSMAEVAMRMVVGDHSVNQVLTSGREQIRIQVRDQLQKLLDTYDTGIQVTNVVLQDVTPPDEVRPSFNEVNEARQEREKLVNQAWEDYNRAVPRARGEAEKTIRTAEGYAVNRVNRATGDAQRFLAVWDEYKNAKDVTRRRLYLEAMRKLLPRVKEKYIIDAEQQGILPFLDLKRKGAGES